MTLELSPPPLPAGVVHVWTATVESLQPQLAELSALLGARERIAHARFAFARDRRVFAVSRGLRRALCAAYLGRAARTIAFHENAWGKPALELDAGERLYFNASHAGDVVMLAFARHGELGVDVEQARPDDAWNDLVAHAFSPAERAALAALPGHRRTAAFWAGWTRKEAFLKWCGRGLGFGLDAFDVEIDAARPAAVLAVRGATGMSDACLLRTLAAPAGYAACLAVDERHGVASHVVRLDVSRWLARHDHGAEDGSRQPSRSRRPLGNRCAGGVSPTSIVW